MKILLVDGTNLLVRACHATEQSRMSADGVNTAPLVVFVNSLSRYVREETPHAVMVAWDGDGGSEYRKGLFPAYKGRRAPSPGDEWDEYKRSSWALVKEFLAFAGVYQIQRSGVEADDLIAHYWRQHHLHDQVSILSSDKDFMQLIDVNTTQIRFSSSVSGSVDRWDVDRVWDTVGCWPEQLGLVMALTGDESDGVLGVHGIGPKKAVKALIDANWVLADCTDPRIRWVMPQVHLAYRLVNLRDPLPGLVLPSLPLFAPTHPGSALYEDFISYLSRYSLKNIKTAVLSGSLWTARASEGRATGSPAS